MQHDATLQLQLVREGRARLIAEAAEHRLGTAARRRTARPSVRRTLGRSLIRVGRAIAAEPEPSLRPASPR
jgi:hypothetical protein